MGWHNATGVILAAATAVSAWSLPVCAQQAAKTSENTPFLKSLLERRPETDLNKDGVLTLEEAQEARRLAGST